jgi:hypothetical protein
MKSPEELAARLARQWVKGELREARLLTREAWPIKLSIGRPTPELLAHDPAAVRAHLQRWRSVQTGKVSWVSSGYRTTSDALEIPRYWLLRSPSEWIEACNDKTVAREYRELARIVEAIDPIFHPLVIRQRSQVTARRPEEVIKAAEVTLQLTPGCAGGIPLRALSIAGCDSKFFERNRNLIQQMLRQRFGDEMKDCSLEQFLGAQEWGEHWLLVVPLDTGLLPFEQQRVRAFELAERPLPGSHVIVVENERCLHLLPQLPATIAILGSGLNLGWMGARWLQRRQVAYWGDIDTWGLLMLARARIECPLVHPLMMDRSTFDRVAPDAAVAEAESAGSRTPDRLTEEEQQLYKHLLSLDKGRLEQEFIPQSRVAHRLNAWFSH